ncbi:MAG TPA: DUF4149 domain-containing protein [Candidatus Binatia bacterium]|nr:DUF4149 domain-containing protein [Candidatus Binatia bacterium]
MLRLVFALAVAVWLGSVVCVSFIVTPAAHGTFPTPEARRFLRPIFPRYYRLGLGCGIAALAAVLLGRSGLPQEELVRLTAPVAIAMLTTIGGDLLLPRLRETDRTSPGFERLHLASTMLNTTTLAALALAVAAAVAR